MASFIIEAIIDGSVAEYAYTRALDPNSGDMIMRGPTWKGGEPMAEVVVRVLRTALGSYAPDPLFGLDYSVFDHMTTGAEASIKSAVERALKYLSDGRYIQRLAVTASVVLRNGVAAASVSVEFYDPRSRRNVRVKGAF
jgi:phage baseplate assembly protein W